MPIHDWSRVAAGTFHNFHYRWRAAICDALNDGILPEDYFAMAEQRAGGPIPDVLALHVPPAPAAAHDKRSGLAVKTKPPRARHIVHTDSTHYSQRANRISVRDELGEVVAIIELVSPGNKSTAQALDKFVKKLAEFYSRGIHLLVVDLFPPTLRDPQGLHPLIWQEPSEDDEELYALPPDKPLTVASYDAESFTGYVDNVAVGDVLPDAPLFLAEDWYVPCPLEMSYQTAWNVMPLPIRRLFDAPGSSGIT